MRRLRTTLLTTAAVERSKPRPIRPKKIGPANETDGRFAVDRPRTSHTGGAEPLEGFSQVQHPRPMLSLANAFDDDEFMAWHTRVANLLERDQFDIACELKFDGLAVALTYENGLFVQGATRGNGLVGEDVTLNLRTINSIPLKVIGNDFPQRFEVRGEVYFPKSEFQRFNELRIERGDHRDYQQLASFHYT